jgi:hypothetical protein
VKVAETTPGNNGAPEKERPLDPTEIEIEIEITFWNTVKDSGDAEMFEAYLEKYPHGQFRSLAEISLRKIR